MLKFSAIRSSRRYVIAGLVLQLFFMTGGARAMNMPSYDTVSLVYFSTDIVIADLSEDATHTFTATVTETLYGSLRPGERLDTLTGFLTYFSPMKNGMRVILFLDRRPKKYDFFHANLAKSPFAIPPSGVYLVDQYQHVHSYFQVNNPGPYVAAGWWTLRKAEEPSKEDDLKLPSLDEERTKIGEAIKAVEPLRSLLSKTAAREDAPELLKLLDRSSASRENCGVRMAAAITEQATQQIRSLKDPELLLKAHIYAGDEDYYESAQNFISTGNGNEEEDARFGTARAKFLVQVLSDKSKELKLRLAAARLLLLVALNHPGGGVAKVLPLDAEVLAGSAVELRAAAKSIFDDEGQDGNLRGLCLEFIFDQPGMLEDARRVYARTRSNALRFMIEELFLVQSDATYETLHSPSGAAASIMGQGTICGCWAKAFDGAVFFAEWRERKDLHERLATASSDIELRPVLLNLKTGQRFVVEKTEELGGSTSSDGSGRWQFRMTNLEGIPAGDYSVGLEYLSGSKILASGYKTTAVVRDTLKGKEITINPTAGGEPPVGWVD